MLAPKIEVQEGSEGDFKVGQQPPKMADETTSQRDDWNERGVEVHSHGLSIGTESCPPIGVEL